MGKFVRDFTIETVANKFAAGVGGKVYVLYDYDIMKREIIKIYRVRY